MHVPLFLPVASAALLAERRLGVGPHAVVLEYTCGASNSLDLYSTYLTPDQLADVFAQIEGNFVGLGVELRAHDGALLIERVIFEGHRPRHYLVREGSHLAKLLVLRDARIETASSLGSPLIVNRGAGLFVVDGLELHSAGEQWLYDVSEGTYGSTNVSGGRRRSNGVSKRAISSPTGCATTGALLSFRGNMCTEPRRSAVWLSCGAPTASVCCRRATVQNKICIYSP